MCISEVVHVAFLILSNPEINADVHLLKLNIQFLDHINLVLNIVLNIYKENIKRNVNFTHFNLFGYFVNV